MQFSLPAASSTYYSEAITYFFSADCFGSFGIFVATTSLLYFIGLMLNYIVLDYAVLDYILLDNVALDYIVFRLFYVGLYWRIYIFVRIYCVECYELDGVVWMVAKIDVQKCNFTV